MNRAHITGILCHLDDKVWLHVFRHGQATFHGYIAAMEMVADEIFTAIEAGYIAPDMGLDSFFESVIEFLYQRSCAGVMPYGWADVFRAKIRNTKPQLVEDGFDEETRKPEGVTGEDQVPQGGQASGPQDPTKDGPST